MLPDAVSLIVYELDKRCLKTPSELPLVGSTIRKNDGRDRIVVEVTVKTLPTPIKLVFLKAKANAASLLHVILDHMTRKACLPDVPLAHASIQFVVPFVTQPLPQSTDLRYRHRAAMSLFAKSFAEEFVEEILFINEVERGRATERSKNPSRFKQLVNIAVFLSKLVPIPGVAAGVLASVHIADLALGEVYKTIVDLLDDVEKVTAAKDAYDEMMGEDGEKGIDRGPFDVNILRPIARQLGWRLAFRYEQAFGIQPISFSEEKITAFARYAVSHAIYVLFPLDDAVKSVKLDPNDPEFVDAVMEKFSNEEEPEPSLYKKLFEKRPNDKEQELIKMYGPILKYHAWYCDNPERQPGNIAEETLGSVVPGRLWPPGATYQSVYIARYENRTGGSLVDGSTTSTIWASLLDWCDKERACYDVSASELLSYLKDIHSHSAAGTPGGPIFSLQAFLDNRRPEDKKFNNSARLLITNRDLTGYSLAGGDFSGCDFSGSIIRGDLSGANFSKCNLFGVTFDRCTANSGQELLFYGSDLAFASFRNANFKCPVDFRTADCTSVDFSHATFGTVKTLGATFYGAKLKTMKDDADIPKASKKELDKLRGEVREELTLLKQRVDRLEGRLEKLEPPAIFVEVLKALKAGYARESKFAEEVVRQFVAPGAKGRKDGDDLDIPNVENHFLVDFLSQPESSVLLLLGESGAGKSSYVWKMASLASQKLTSTESSESVRGTTAVVAGGAGAPASAPSVDCATEPHKFSIISWVPIVIDLGNFSSTDLRDGDLLDKHLKKRYGASDSELKNFREVFLNQSTDHDNVARSTRLLVFCDGLDRLRDSSSILMDVKDFRSKVLGPLAVSENNGRIKVIFTSRSSFMPSESIEREWFQQVTRSTSGQPVRSE